MLFWPLIKRCTYSATFIVMAGGIFLAVDDYQRFEHIKARRVVEEIKIDIESIRVSSLQVAAAKKILQQHPEVVYFLLLDPSDYRGMGVVNVESFSHGAQYIDTTIQEKGISRAFDMLKKMQENPNPHITLMEDYWVEQSTQVKYAYLNPTNYFQWGPRGLMVRWGLYVWYGLGLVLAISSFVYWKMPLRMDRKNIVIEPEEEAVAPDDSDEALDFDDQEPIARPSFAGTEDDLVEGIIYDEDDEIVTGHLDEDDTKIDSIPSQVWQDLLDQPDLKDWETQGSFYVRKDKKGLHAIGFPWASSIVTRKEVLFSEFIFEAEGRVLSGNEGFAVLFAVDQHCLAWVLGGWNNTQSIVLGFEATKTFHQIHPKKWHHIRIELENQEVIGYIDGRTAWSLPVQTIAGDSPDAGFQNGFGVGVFKTTVKFRNIRILRV